MVRKIVDAQRIGRQHPRQAGWLFRDVTVSIAAGQRLALVGPTGSGKTLLLRALAFLDPLDQGEIHWREQLVRGGRVARYRADVMYLHQSPVLFEGTVEDNLRLPLTLKQHAGKQFDRTAVMQQLEAMQRSNLLTLSAQSLSGGERQIVALLRAMQLDPTVLLLDEPTASLDAATARLIERLIQEWQADKGEHRAYVWVSHSAEQVSRIATEVLQVENGTLTRGAADA